MTKKNRRNYYRILHVQPDAAFEVIRGSYRALLKELKMHPDFGGDVWNAQVLTEAYEVLGDSKSRASYDRELFLEYTKRDKDSGMDGKRPLTSVFCCACGRPLARADETDSPCDVCRPAGQPTGPEESDLPDAASEADATPPPESTTEVSESVEEPDRREVHRTARGGEIAYHRGDSTLPERGVLLDLSPHGLRFLAETPLEIGSIVRISSEDVDAVGEVTSSDASPASDDVGVEVGIRFRTVEFRKSRGTFMSTVIA